MAKQPKMPNMQQMLKQVEKMQRDVEEAQESLKHEQVEASAGGGMVKAVVSGDLVVKEISIDPDVVDPEDSEMLGDLVLAAVNEALRAAQELQATRMEKATGGLGGPGGPLGGLGGSPGLGGLGMPGL
jgi:DNA-binding YbaB/EbfC family protein